MKKVKMLVLGLTLSLLALSAIAVEQVGYADPLGCRNLTGCKNGNQCGDRGTANGCVIQCEGGGTVTCPVGTPPPPTGEGGGGLAGMTPPGGN